MLYRPPLTSPRRGWMELPDVKDLPNVGDYCLVVIQKWMNHILSVVPLHLLYVWYDIHSFGYMFLYMLWIRMIWMQRQRRRLSFCTVFVIDMLWKVSFTVDMLRNVPYAVDMLRNISYAIDKLRNVSFIIDMLRNVPYAVDMLQNISYAIDKLWNISFVIDMLRNISFVADMLQLLYAPSVMNQLCMIEMTIVILHLMILCLWIRIFCLAFWNFISLEIVLFWHGYVSHLLSFLCSPRCCINFSG